MDNQELAGAPATSHLQVPYNPPGIPQLLSISGYLYLLSFTSTLFSQVIGAPLLGPLLVGILFGPVLAGLIPESAQRTFIDLGYVGLLLIVFEAGLTTDMSLLIGNLGLSLVAALTGIGLPIALSMMLLHAAFGYSAIQAFAGGAALSSTSLGTTLALLTPQLRKTRVGSVLMSAALLDDIVGLVIAAIIPNLAATSHGMKWQTIARPILVSLAFALLVPLVAFAVRKVVTIQIGLPVRYQRYLCDPRFYLFSIIVVLSAFVAGSKYAGTSELFGAYLAGAFMAYISSNSLSSGSPETSSTEVPKAVQDRGDFQQKVYSATPEQSIHEHPTTSPTERAFTTHLAPIVEVLLGPIFFGSIGTALPVRALFTANGSANVVWRGIIYSMLMVLAKMAVGLCIFIWPEPGAAGNRWFGKDTLPTKGKGDIEDRGGAVDGTSVIEREDRLAKQTSSNWDPPVQTSSRLRRDTVDSVFHDRLNSTSASNLNTPNLKSTTEPTRRQAALLLGLAMVARGEIALIVAQLARLILLGPDVQKVDEELFAVVIWAILVSTVGGALGVGLLLRSWERCG